MATTYLAHKRGDFFFERLVVVKRIHPWLVEQPDSHDMLREEARLAAAVQHPNVVHVEDIMNEDHEVCLVMPYVESLSLGALIKTVCNAGERIPPTIASRILLDVLAGLDAAHEAKDLRGLPLDIVHRDVSPNNVLVGSDGRSRIIDFGIARAARRLSHTQSGDMKGTIAYMSPEQLRRRELDRRADVFAAGAVFFESLMGSRLFEGRDEADILLGVLADEIPSVVGVVENVNAHVDEVLARALCRDRDERFPTARAFAEALEAALAPAPATDVALFMERFAAAELLRRRNAIREFVDRQATSAPEGAVAHMAEKNRRDRRRTIGALLSGVVLIAIIVIVVRNQKVSKAVQAEEPPKIQVADRVENHELPEPPSAPPVEQPQSSAMISGVAASAHPAIVAPNASTFVRTKMPLRERVDKRRASELQENPYR
jgi:serine/threonine-protein kinase